MRSSSIVSPRPVDSTGVQKDGITGLAVPRQDLGRAVHNDINLSTPGGEQLIVSKLSLHIEPGDHWVISGRTGVGKSSLLRLMAGLWCKGSGVVTLPPVSETLFLPQRPYMLPGTLREQLFYPHRPSGNMDAQLQSLLERVCLPDLAARCGGFDTSRDWSRILSLGEQQRIAIARALVVQPRYLFLDEATSAVDFATERALYGALADSGITCVSVGHRESLLDFHHHELRLLGLGRWQVSETLRAVDEGVGSRAGNEAQHRSGPVGIQGEAAPEERGEALQVGREGKHEFDQQVGKLAAGHV